MSEAHARRDLSGESVEETIAEVSRDLDPVPETEPLEEATEALESADELEDDAPDMSEVGAGIDETAAQTPETPSVLELERLASLLTGQGPKPDEDDETPGAAPSLHGYHEWHLQRLQRRLRWVTWALIAFVAVGGAAIAYLLATPASLAPGTDQTADNLADDLERLETGLGSLEGARTEDAEAIGSITTSFERIEDSIARIDQRLQKLNRCMNGAFADLDRDMRALLQRNMSANAFVGRPIAGGCKISKGAGSQAP